MVVIQKYYRNGSSEKKEFNSKFHAFLWLYDNIAESEWCWIMYEKEN